MAIENKQGPFLNLEKHIKESSVENIECHLADGIDYLPSNIDCCCILGMGGTTIYEILSKNKNKLDQLKTIIIEPQSNFSQPITFLLKNGYVNTSGQYIYEKRYYPLLKFEKGNQNISKLEEKYGPYPVRNKDIKLKEMILKEIKQLNPFRKEASTKSKLEILEHDLMEIYK